MNALKTQAVLLATLLTAGLADHALAQEAESDTWQTVASTSTRAQVRAELAQARASGEFAALNAEAAFEPSDTARRLARAPSGGKTRAEVRAELDQARRSGELMAINAEAHAFAPALPAPQLMAQRAR